MAQFIYIRNRSGNRYINTEWIEQIMQNDDGCVIYLRPVAGTRSDQDVINVEPADTPAVLNAIDIADAVG